MKQISFAILLATSICFSQYSLKVEQIGGARHAGEENLFRAILMDNGKIIQTVERKLPYDVPFPASYINKTTGTVVLTFVFDGFVEVYNNKGVKQWEENFFKGMGPNYERTINVALGTSSVAFLTSDVTLQKAKVQRYKINGEKEWETSLPYSMGNEIEMSNDEQSIIAGSYFVLEDEVRQASTIVDRNGTIEGYANILFRKAAFSDDAKIIALTSDREIVLLSNETKKETGRTSKKTAGIITDVIWSGSELIVQESEVKTTPDHQFYFANPTFVWYSEKLIEITRKKIDNAQYKISSLNKKGSGIELHINGTMIPISR